MQTIAIVGMACRYPEASSPAALWENVLAQRAAFRRIPAVRLRPEDYPGPADAIRCDMAAVLKDYEFDRAKYRISGASHRAVDASHWLALEVAGEALEAVGHRVPKETTAVYVGNSLTGDASRSNLMRLRWPYVERVIRSACAELTDVPRLDAVVSRIEQLYKEPFPATGEESLAGGLSNTIAGRICNYFDLNGGGYTIDGACASSLLATAHACIALQNGLADLAVAGGVDLSLDPFELAGFSALGALARERMRVYDHYPTGFWPGEGCGFAVLMREEDAIAQGVPVLARIRGWGISSDGHGGITRPEVRGQLLALRRAYASVEGGVAAPAYFEGHGTGTMVGDATELQTLSRARREAHASTPAVVGSVKTLIGHTKAAAGIAGLMKACFAVSTQILPPTSGCRDPHPELGGDAPALRVASRAEIWPQSQPLLAGVSAMGFGGINAHVAVEGVTSARRTRISVPEQALVRTPQDAETFVFAAHDAVALLAQVREVNASTISYAEMADCAGALAKLADAACKCRGAVVASSPTELVARLADLADSIERSPDKELIDPAAGVFFSGSRKQPAPIGLLFSGQASPVYRSGGAWAGRFAAVDEFYAGLEVPEGADQSTDVAQYTIAAASAVAVEVLQRLGIEARVALGHSLGELSALHWAGAYDRRTLLELARHRGEVMAKAGRASDGAMLAIAVNRSDAEALVEGSGLVVASENSRLQTVVSGRRAAIEALREKCRKRGIEAIPLPVSCAFHSPLMNDAAEAFALYVAGVKSKFGNVRGHVVSSMSGAAIASGVDLQRWFRDQILAPVGFAGALDEAAEHASIFFEVGPGHVLTGLARGAGRTAIALDAGSRTLAGLCQAIAAAFALGHTVRWEHWFGDRKLRPFDIRHVPTFLSNPCESVPVCQFEVHAAATDASEAVVLPAVNGNQSCKALLMEYIARRTELPVESLHDGLRFLSDLHLNSITVTQIVAQISGQLGIRTPMLPVNFADVTLREAAEALDELVRSEEGSALSSSASDGATTVAGVASWARPFDVSWVERPLQESAVRRQAGKWQVIAPEGVDCSALRLELEQNCGDGLLVYLPSGRTPDIIPLLLDVAATTARMRPRLLVVQEEVGAEPFFRSLYLEQALEEVVLVEGSAECNSSIVREGMCRMAGFRECRYEQATGTRLERRMEACREIGKGEFPLPAGSWLLVTGGGKGIGAECGISLAAKYSLGLVIPGRSNRATDEQLAANLARIEALGIQCVYIEADVTDEAAVREKLSGLEVAGVLHAAGVNIPKPSSQMDVLEVLDAVRPKVDGLRHVLGALSVAPKLVVTFGSVIAQSGLEGEAHYALANGWMADELRDWSSAHPEACALQLDWSVWGGTGMGERLGSLDALERRGISAISIEAGVAELDAAILRCKAGFQLQIVSGRLGSLPTLRMDEPELPLLRFLERPVLHVPGVELICEATLSDEHDPYLADHVFGGETLLPAVVGMEAMAQVATTLMGGRRLRGMSGIELNRPILLNESGTQRIRVAALCTGESGSVDVVIRCEDTGFHANHFCARLDFDAEAGAMDVIPATERQGGGDVGIDPVRDLYGTILFHGGRFQRLRSYSELRAKRCESHLMEGQPLSWFGAEMPASLLLGDPGVRDAALHSIQACIPQATLLPVRIEQVVACGSFATARMARAVERERKGDLFVYDMDILDAAGEPVEQWRGLVLKAFPNKAATECRWHPALLVPYLERVLEDSTDLSVSVAIRSAQREGRAERRAHVAAALLGSNGAIYHRPDGRPEVAEGSISFSHLEPITIGIQAPRTVSCDMVEVHSNEPGVWRQILGEPMYTLAECASSETGKPMEECSALVWAAFECLRKSGANPGQTLSLNVGRSNGWLCFDAGPTRIVSGLRRMTGVSGPVAMGVLFAADRGAAGR